MWIASEWVTPRSFKPCTASSLYGSVHTCNIAPKNIAVTQFCCAKVTVGEDRCDCSLMTLRASPPDPIGIEMVEPGKAPTSLRRRVRSSIDPGSYCNPAFVFWAWFERGKHIFVNPYQRRAGLLWAPCTFQVQRTLASDSRTTNNE